LEKNGADVPLGSTVTVSIAQAHDEPSVEIPLAAIYDKGRGPGVWLLQGEQPKATWRPVRLAGVGDETARVTGGLNAGDRFVALGAHLLHEGQSVRVARGARIAGTAAANIADAGNSK
jgi:hypothetical protein